MPLPCPPQRHTLRGPLGRERCRTCCLFGPQWWWYSSGMLRRRRRRRRGPRQLPSLSRWASYPLGVCEWSGLGMGRPVRVCPHLWGGDAPLGLPPAGPRQTSRHPHPRRVDQPPPRPLGALRRQGAATVAAGASFPVAAGTSFPPSPRRCRWGMAALRSRRCIPPLIGGCHPQESAERRLRQRCSSVILLEGSAAWSPTLWNCTAQYSTVPPVPPPNHPPPHWHGSSDTATGSHPGVSRRRG